MTTATKKAVQAKSITDEEVLRVVKRRSGYDSFVSAFEIQAELSSFPDKVVLAKLRSMVKRGLLSGCACGCSGNFRRTKS